MCFKDSRFKLFFLWNKIHIYFRFSSVLVPCGNHVCRSTEVTSFKTCFLISGNYQTKVRNKQTFWKLDKLFLTRAPLTVLSYFTSVTLTPKRCRCLVSMVTATRHDVKVSCIQLPSELIGLEQNKTSEDLKQRCQIYSVSWASLIWTQYDSQATPKSSL